MEFVVYDCQYGMRRTSVQQISDYWSEINEVVVATQNQLINISDGSPLKTQAFKH